MSDDRTVSQQLSHLTRIVEKGFETLADAVGETNERLDETNQRLGRLELRVDQTNERLDQTNERLDETNERLGRLEGRVDNLIDTAGSSWRLLRHDVDDLRERVERLERKAS